MIILALILFALAVAWALARLPAGIQGLLMAAAMVVAFGWLGLLGVLAAVALGVGIVIRD